MSLWSQLLVDSGMDSPTTYTLRALGVEVQIEIPVTVAWVLAELEPLLVTPSGGEPAARWVVEDVAEGWRFRPGHAQSTVRADPMELVGPIVDRLNFVVGRHSPAVAVHAGAVAVRDAGVLIAGPSNAGKSTLTAALTLAGAAYLGDEAIGLDPTSRRLLGYAKPLSLDGGSLSLMPQLGPLANHRGATVDQWNVPMHRLRDDAIVTEASLSHVVLCRYEPEADTILTPLSRAEAVFELCGLTFRFEDRERLSLDTLAAVSEGATCHRLVSGHLASATDAVLELLA